MHLMALLLLMLAACTLVDIEAEGISYNTFDPTFHPLMLTNPSTFRYPKTVDLVVAVAEWIPHVGAQVDPVTGNITATGPMVKLLNELAQAINFRYRFVTPPDGAWGAPQEGNISGAWNGMIGIVKRKEAHLALGPFGLTKSRASVVSFSTTIIIDTYRILVRRRKPQPDPWGWRSPFTFGVWIGFALALVGTALVFWTVTRVGWGTMNGLMFNLWIFYSSTLSQPMRNFYTCDKARVLYLIWLMAVPLIAGRSYCSSLTALLAVRTIDTPYNFLKDVIGDKSLTLVFEASTALTEYLGVVKTGVYAELAAQKSRSSFVSPPELYVEAYTNVRSEDSNTALLVEDTTCRKIMADAFSDRGVCEFYVAKERYWPLIFAMIGQKGHPIMDAINARLDRMISHNLYFKWLSDEMPNNTACVGDLGRVVVDAPYSMAGLYGIFVTLAAGLAVSAMCFIVEIARQKRR